MPQNQFFGLRRGVCQMADAAVVGFFVEKGQGQRFVALLPFGLGKIDAATVDSGGGARFKASQIESQLFQLGGKPIAARKSVGTLFFVYLPTMILLDK